MTVKLAPKRSFEKLNHLREEYGSVFVVAGADFRWGGKAAAASSFQHNAALADLLEAVVLEVDILIEVEGVTRIRTAQFFVQEAQVRVELFEARIVVGDDLGEEGVEAAEDESTSYRVLQGGSPKHYFSFTFSLQSLTDFPPSSACPPRLRSNCREAARTTRAAGTVLVAWPGMRCILRGGRPPGMECS